MKAIFVLIIEYKWSSQPVAQPAELSASITSIPSTEITGKEEDKYLQGIINEMENKTMDIFDNYSANLQTRMSLH